MGPKLVPVATVVLILLGGCAGQTGPKSTGEPNGVGSFRAPVITEGCYFDGCLVNSTDGNARLALDLYGLHQIFEMRGSSGVILPSVSGKILTGEFLNGT